MKTLLLAGALLAPVLAVAQTTVTPAETAPHVTASEILVVTATGNATPLSEVLAPTQVIERADIERAQAGDLAEILRTVAGFDLERFGGPGQLTQFRVRGGETDHVLLLIDGVRINPATGAAVFQNLSPEAIDRIEIVKGPRSTLYGSDAITAVVNVITRSGDNGVGGRVRFGSDETRDTSARFAYSGEPGSLSLDVEHSRSEGFPVFKAVPIDRGYERTTLNLRGATRVGAVDVAVRGNNSQGNNEYIGFNSDTFTNDKPVSQDFTSQVGAIEFAGSPLTAWNSRFTASRAYDDLQSKESPNRVRTTRPQVDWNNVIALGENHRLTLGAGYAWEKANIVADYCSTGVCEFQETRDIRNLRMQTESAAGRHRLLLGAAWTDHDAFGDKSTWNAEYGFDLFKDTRLIAAAGTGFRAPNAFERFGDPFVGGNPEVKSETSKNLEFGLRQRLGQRQVLDVRVFRNDTEDLIAFDPATFTVNNVRRFRNEGLDLSYRIDAEWLSATLTAIWQDPIDRDTDQTLVRRARRTAGLRLARDTSLYSLGFDVVASGERPDVDPDTFGPTIVPGYALYNLNAGLQVAKQTRLEARWENVSDKDYQTVAGYLQAGSSGYVGLRYGF